LIELDYKDVFRANVTYATRVFEILERVRNYAPDADFDLIKRAYVFAAHAHGPQKRKSGELFITHPLAVAGLLAEMGLDVETVVTGLLHDTVEDTQASLMDIEHHFGSVVADLVDGVTKLSGAGIESKETKEAESLRKMILAMSKDIRVLFVKLADRLHNMSTLGSMPLHRAKVKADECLTIYAPLANRLGLYWIKQALQDLAFFTHDRKTFCTLQQLRDEKITALNHTPTEMANIMRSILESHDLTANVTWRAKHIYSLHQKIQSKNLAFDQVHDMLAFRIVVKDRAACYQALGIIHELYQNKMGRIKDYIGTPKSNGYQSLHTSVYDNDGCLLEVQIRSQEMDHRAENGFAAHWLYKDSAKELNHQTMAWLRNLADLSKEVSSPAEFLENVQLDLFIQEIFVFSRDGELYSLPRNATALDFAYAVHSDIGHQCMGVIINNKNASLSQRLRNGDRIEVITNPEQGPSFTWLKLVKTPRALRSIRHFFKKQNQQDSIALGRRMIKNISKNPLSDQVLSTLKCPSIESLEVQLGRGETSLGQLYSAMSKHQNPLDISGIDQRMLYPASCCHPVPGDAIVGKIVANRGFELHYYRCHQVLTKNHEDWQNFEWQGESKQLYTTGIELTTQNKRGMLAELSILMTKAHADIEDLRMHQLSGGITHLLFLVDVRGRNHLADIMRLLRNIDGVNTVKRDNHGDTETREKMQPIHHAVANMINRSKETI